MAENVIEALPSEKITQQLQQKKAERLGKNAGTPQVTPSELSSGAPSAADEDGRSLSSFRSESYVHASQIGDSTSGNGDSKPPSSKAQLWHDLKISCQCPNLLSLSSLKLIHYSNYEISYSTILSHFTNSINSHSTQPPRSKKLSFKRRIFSFVHAKRANHQNGKSR